MPDCTRSQNRDDETLTSICNRCRLTIGRASRRADLRDLELRHVCQLLERRKVIRVAHHIYNHNVPSRREPAAAFDFEFHTSGPPLSALPLPEAADLRPPLSDGNLQMLLSKIRSWF